MNTPPNREVALFSAARKLPAAQRGAWLDETCAADADLRRRVEELLQAAEEAGAFLQEPAPGAQRLSEAAAPPNACTTMPVTRYCDENHLNMEQRLRLFVQVCQAIQHAHQKGIIHRDIKPSNILVADHDGVPVPKIIDFGIAKATTDQRLTDKTLFTAFEQFIGTPAYMSPEQAKLSGLDIDTRSDIYSLGVLLYELLTGKTPFAAQELFASGLDEMRRTIREKEQPKPSTRLTQELVA